MSRDGEKNNIEIEIANTLESDLLQCFIGEKDTKLIEKKIYIHSFIK